jgi:hypothetical protein
MKDNPEFSILLHKEERKDIGREVCARMDTNSLVIDGCDWGDLVERWHGDWDYEYFLTIKDEHMDCLFKALDLNSKSAVDLLGRLYEKFRGNECFENIRKFLEGNKIPHKYSFWV